MEYSPKKITEELNKENFNFKKKFGQNFIVDKNIIHSIIKKADILYKSKEEILEFLDYINILLLKKAKQNYKYTTCIEIVENTKKRIKQNANYDMCIDNMIFNMWEEIN